MLTAIVRTVCGTVNGPSSGRAGKSSRIHLWDGQNIAAEIGATGTVIGRYLRGVNLIAREQDENLYYYLFNAHGDVTGTADATGGTLRNYHYDAFGVEEALEELDQNPFRYCGEYFDDETGEVYLRARRYNPSTGRFCTEDPARSGFNWYSYCASNPIVLFDPTGSYYLVEEAESTGSLNSGDTVDISPLQ